MISPEEKADIQESRSAVKAFKENKLFVKKLTKSDIPDEFIEHIRSLLEFQTEMLDYQKKLLWEEAQKAKDEFNYKQGDGIEEERDALQEEIKEIRAKGGFPSENQTNRIMVLLKAARKLADLKVDYTSLESDASNINLDVKILDLMKFYLSKSDNDFRNYLIEIGNIKGESGAKDHLKRQFELLIQ